MDYPSIPKFIARIEKYCTTARIEEASLAQYALKDRGFVERLRRGYINYHLLAKLGQYMDANPPELRTKPGQRKAK